MVPRRTRQKKRAARRNSMARVGRWEGNLEPQRVLRRWRRVLERRLRARMGLPVAVELHDNTHTMVTYRRERGFFRLRLHHMFLAAPDAVVTALARYVRFSDGRSSLELDRFIEERRAFIRRVPLDKLRARLRIDPRGTHHDLRGIFLRLNRRFFAGRVDATITYGSAPSRELPRKSIKMGSYSADARIIRIHPALDNPAVPRFFVEWIVFHEMLHHVHRARRDGRGRRCVHTPEFLAHEREFPDFGRAQAWEDENLGLLLAYRTDVTEE